LEQPQTETLMAKFKERIKDKQVPEHAAKVINEEMVRKRTRTRALVMARPLELTGAHLMNSCYPSPPLHDQEKFQHLSPSSTEYNVVRTYLDWLTTLPWDTLTKDNLDMHHAESSCPTHPPHSVTREKQKSDSVSFAIHNHRGARG
jgi:ATP-dependent Lon protease